MKLREIDKIIIEPAYVVLLPERYNYVRYLIDLTGECELSGTLNVITVSELPGYVQKMNVKYIEVNTANGYLELTVE